MADPKDHPLESLNLITMENTDSPKMPFSTFLLRVLSGVAGGVLGAVVLVVIYLVASSMLPAVNDIQGEGIISPVIIFLLLIMVFLSSTAGNILSTFLLGLTEREKYKRNASTLTQVFTVNLIIFLLMVPVYFLTASMGIEAVAYVVTVHMIIAAQVSVLIMEIVSNYRYSLVGVYGTTFAVVVAIAILFILARVLGNAPILIFLALPVVWGSIALVGSLVTVIYGWLAGVYDKDFLSTQTMYGDDYGKEVESEEDVAPKAEDTEGADFLRKN